MNHESIEFAQYKAQRIKELVPEYNKLGISILDFGCGVGITTNYLQEVFFDTIVVGVDISERAIDQACTTYPHIEFKHLEHDSLDFPDNHFDIIIASEVFHHITFANHKKYINEVMRVLKPNGVFVLLELNAYNLNTLFRFKRDPREQGNRLLSPRYVSILLKKYGKKTFYYFCFFPRRLGFLVFAEHWLIKVPFGQLYAVVVFPTQKK